MDDHALIQAFSQKDTLVLHTTEEKVGQNKKNWICMNHLQINDAKTEFITFGTSNLLSKKRTLIQSQSKELQSIAQKQ